MSDGHLLRLIEARLAESHAIRDRLTRESALLREAATQLRMGASQGPVVAVLWAAGVDLSETSAEVKR